MSRRVEEKKEAKEKNIVNAALELFSQQGFHDTTIDEIAQQAGVAKGTVYLYFRDKESIFRHIIALVSRQQQEKQNEILEIEGWVEKLRQYILVQSRFFMENAYLARISVQEMHGLNHEASSVFFDALSRHEGILTAILRGGSRKGVFDVENVEETASALLGMINFYLVRSSLRGQNTDENKTTDFLLRLALQSLTALPRQQP